MNDERYDLGDDIPDWAWEIVERHQLEDRTDCPLAAATVLLTDTADLLLTARLIAFEEQAITAESRRRIADCAAMIGDALRLAELCPSEPISGTVSIEADGALTWTDAGRRPA